MPADHSRPDETLVAWVDESGSSSALDPGTYILSAAVALSSTVEATRAAATALKLPGQRKLHWVDENRRRRLHMVRTFAELELEHLVVVRSHPTANDPLERRRKKCLERLLVELEGLDVDRAILESRGQKQDQLDHKMLGYLRSTHAVNRIRMDHAPGPSDAMLWIPDTCCGAIVADRCGEREYFDLLRGKATVYVI